MSSPHPMSPPAASSYPYPIPISSSFPRAQTLEQFATISSDRRPFLHSSLVRHLCELSPSHIRRRRPPRTCLLSTRPLLFSSRISSIFSQQFPNPTSPALGNRSSPADGADQGMRDWRLLSPFSSHVVPFLLGESIPGPSLPPQALFSVESLRPPSKTTVQNPSTRPLSLRPTYTPGRTAVTATPLHGNAPCPGGASPSTRVRPLFGRPPTFVLER